MTTVMADNIHNLAVDGNFDDCQAMIKASFNDKSFLPEDRQLAFEADRGIEIVFGPYLGRSDIITLQTYSVMDILVETAGYIRAPEQHIVDGRTQGNRDYDSADPLTRPPVRILSSKEKPDMAVVSVKNRDHWFYIDDRDIESKKSFSFLMILLQLQASHESGKAPVVTIGTGS